MNKSNGTHEYKGFVAVLEADTEDDVLYGTVLYTTDAIAFEAETPKGWVEEFHKAIDAYLAFCELKGRQPQKSLTGSLNVRLGAELHKALADKSATSGRSINDLIKGAVSAFVNPYQAPSLPSGMYWSGIYETNDMGAFVTAESLLSVPTPKSFTHRVVQLKKFREQNTGKMAS